MSDIVSHLADTLAARRSADPDRSYVAALYRDGLEAILAKVAEESAETIAAARGEGPDGLVHEVADLWFHTMVLLVHSGLDPREVLEELERRARR